MAGNRMYYSNVQTNARGSVQLTSQINFDGAATPSVVNGAGFAITGGGATNVWTLQFPERFAPARVHNIELSFVNATTTWSFPVLASAYTTPTVVSTPSSCTIVFFAQLTTTQTVSPKGTLYVSFEAALGM